MRISDWSSDVCSSDLQRLEHAEQNKYEPKWRRQIGGCAHQQLKPVDPVKSRSAKQAQMLQVSLTPAAVAHRQVSKGWRKFLMTSRGKIGNMDAPAATAEQGGLPLVRTQILATLGLLPAKYWQTP